jgi:hypothetical protein
VTTRSWFDDGLDPTAYLEAVAAEASAVVSPAVLAALERASRRDASRRRDEALIAQGRVALIQGRWRHAAGIFARLVRAGEARTRAVAALGLVCAGARTDMEPLISGIGRHSLPSRRHIASHRGSGTWERPPGRSPMR